MAPRSHLQIAGVPAGSTSALASAGAVLCRPLAAEVNTAAAQTSRAAP